MRVVLLALAAGALFGGVAQAKDDPNVMAAGQGLTETQAPARLIKMLYVCSEDERSWRPVFRDLGIPEFVTAERVQAENRRDYWATPKCITPTEMRRLSASVRPRDMPQPR